MILLIDNYDSFTYNLYQYIGEFDKDIKVVRNDQITAAEINNMDIDRIVISPGPKDPFHAGNCLDILKNLEKDIPVLGICLGHQCIGEAFGGEVIHAGVMMHGKASLINIKDNKIFKDLNDKEKVARYHSLKVNKDNLPDVLEVIATTDDGEIMALKHKEKRIYGFQFHPESILTDNGMKMIENFMKLEE